MTLHQNDRLQHTWARVAGLMYWVVLIVDLAGMQIHSSVGRSLSLAGALFTVPLAFGLYFAVRPQQAVLAVAALLCRLMEATLGMISVLAGYATIQAKFSGTGLGGPFLHLAEWDDRTDFAAFVFAIGSTLFFYLFLKASSIPRSLAWLGLFGSLLALFVCGAHLLRPAFPAMTMYAWIPMLLAETSTGFWLLFRSVKVAAPSHP